MNKKAKVKKPATRPYRCQKNSRKHPSIDLAGVIFPPGAPKVCRKSALHFLGLSETRVRRVCDGLPDGRTRGQRLPNDHPSFSPQWQVCLFFLHHLWHYFAEGLPDRFQFETRDRRASRLTLGTKPEPGSDHRGSELKLDADSEASDADEDDERALGALALHIHSAEANGTLRGPGLGNAPCRYIGVMRPVQLYAALSRWCTDDHRLAVPGFTTFLRALGQVKPYLKFRKCAGQHANCDACVAFKKQLKKLLSCARRQEILEAYCRHVLQQLRDRHADMAWQDASVQCSKVLRDGARLWTLAIQLSVILFRVDGVDQAKFRVPRWLQKTHELDKIVRPALHVQGCWAHGFGFHFAVADADQPKDTTTNVEVIARMSEKIYCTHGALPSTLVLIQDNTCRECKNQKILKVCAKWVTLRIYRHIYLNYPEKGHSHGPLDGVFGQATVKLANTEFQDDEDVVQTLDKFLHEGSLEPGTSSNACAYKLDEAAPWVEWAEDDMHFSCSSLTGPEAPHSFHVCLREDLGPQELGPKVLVTAWPGAPKPQGGDVVVALRSNMSDLKAFQVVLLVPQDRARQLQLHAKALPTRSVHPRRRTEVLARKLLISKATACHEKGALSEKAYLYLTDWAKGTRRRHRRPEHYAFLQHRIGQGHAAAQAPPLTGIAPDLLEPKWTKEPRPIEIRRFRPGPCADLEPEPAEDDGDAELEPEPAEDDSNVFCC